MRTRYKVPSLVAVATLLAAAGAGAAPPAARRTCTLSPSTARSFESATASRSGMLGFTTTPAPDGSALSPLAESFVLISPGAPPLMYTSYRSLGDPVAGGALGAAGRAVLTPLADVSSTLYFCSRRRAATFLAV